MAENDSHLKCCLNLTGILGYIVLISALVVSLCALLISNSIGPLFIGILVLIGLLIVIVIVLGPCSMLCLIHCCKPKPERKDWLLNFICICLRLWCSCVLGLMSFVDISGIQNEVKTAITWMLLISIGIKAIWSIVQRYLELKKYSTSPVTWAEMLELVGFSVTGLIVSPEDKTFFSKYALILILVSFAAIVVAVRLVAFFYYAIFVLLSVIFCQMVFFQNVDLSFYDAALGCFAGRLFIDPVFDLLFSNISIEERLNCVFSIRGCLQKMFIIIFIVFEGVFLFHAVVSDIDNKEWYWIILFVVLLLNWICFHSYFIHLCWLFSNEISECAKANQASGNTSMEKMMATKGMRLQAQLTHCLTRYTFASTFLLGALTLLITLLIPSGEQLWHKDDKAALAASCLIVLLVEGMFYAATDTLQKSLPGACKACVIMPPSKSNGQSSREVRESIMEFFEHNAIPCSVESFVNGLSVQTLEGNLKSFFDQTIPGIHGRRYDSYVVYYCGDVDSDGKWELTKGKFKFENMQSLWDSCNTEDFQSRLILIQDAKYSKDWLEKIANDKNNVIAMQTCKLSRSKDPETGVVARVGDFTRDWIKFNDPTENSINWKERGRKIKAVYKVSPSWSDNEFHVPTEKDMTEYTSKFPKKFNYLILRVLSISAKFEDETNCCPCWKRFTMSWFPPPFIDTGHGFKLVKS